MLQERRTATATATAVLLLGLGLGPGCGTTPRARLTDLQGRTRALQAETTELKDAVLALKRENRDLRDRALEDGRRVRALEETNVRLGRAVRDYQQERDRLAAAFEALGRHVRGPDAAVGDRRPAALLRRLDQVAREHPGCRFDRDAAALVVEGAGLFPVGAVDPSPEIEALLGDCAEALADGGLGPLSLRVVAPGGPPVGRASAGGAPTDLGLERARALRDRLAGRSGIDPARIGVAGAPADATDPAPPRVVIQLLGPGGLPAGSGIALEPRGGP